MSAITLASKGYVDNNIIQRHTDIKTGTLDPRMLYMPYVTTLNATFYMREGENLELTHLCWPWLSPTKDNVYLAIAPTGFTSGKPIMVTEEAFNAEKVENVWFKFLNPVKKLYDGYNTGWSGWIRIMDNLSAIHMVEKSIIEGEEVYTSVGKLTAAPSADTNCYNPILPTGVSFSTTGEEIDYGSDLCGRINLRYNMYSSEPTCFSLKYNIYKTDGKNLEAIATTAYVNSKIGLTDGDSSLASKEYVDNLS